MGFTVLTASGSIKRGSAPTNDLTLATGTLPVNHGGTGLATLTGIPLGTGTAPLSLIASPNDATKFLNGAATPAFAAPKDSDLALTDVTTNNVSATAHGFAPKFPNNTTTFLRGDGTYSSPTVASWTFITSQAVSGAAQWDFTGLAGYTELRVMLALVGTGTTAIPWLRVSTDNGSTYLASSGDYNGINTNGVLNALTAMPFLSTSTTTTRTCQIVLYGINLAAPKMGTALFFSNDSIGNNYLPGTGAITAVRVLNSTGANFTTGTIYLFGR